MDKNKSEASFFEMYDAVMVYADKHGVPFHQIMSVREVWDLAYKTGHCDGMTQALDIVQGNTATATAE
jgi:hypothetical protein